MGQPVSQVAVGMNKHRYFANNEFEVSSLANIRPVCVQYGCGITAPSEWINFDASPRLRLERNPVTRLIIKIAIGIRFPENVRFGDVIRGLPISEASAEAVFCSHVLEHLAASDVELALRESFRILKPGGVFRLVVPDLQWRARRYLEELAGGNHQASDEFMRRCMLGRATAERGWREVLRRAFGHSEHLWMFDQANLTKRLADVGFVDVRRCKFGDAHRPLFHSVEDLGRFYDSGEEELALEGLKPANECNLRSGP